MHLKIENMYLKTYVKDMSEKIYENKCNII